MAFQPIYEELLALRKQNRRSIRNTLAARHGWNCHICGCTIPVRLREATYVSAPPDPLFPDVEHVIPRKAGGLHYYGNLRLAHRKCNLAKGAAFNPSRLALLGAKRRGDFEITLHAGRAQEAVE